MDLFVAVCINMALVWFSFLIGRCETLQHDRRLILPTSVLCSASGDEPSAKEKVVLSEECQLVTLMDVVAGKLEISTTHVYFYDKSSNNDEGIAVVFFVASYVDRCHTSFFAWSRAYCYCMLAVNSTKRLLWQTM